MLYRTKVTSFIADEMHFDVSPLIFQAELHRTSVHIVEIIQHKADSHHNVLSLGLKPIMVIFLHLAR